MEETPPFESAVQRLQEFLAKQGWPTRLVWRMERDIVHSPDRQIVVRRRREPQAADVARSYYDEGFRRRVGVALAAWCEVDGAACTTVYWTTDTLEAGCRMLPDHGLKLSVAIPHSVGRGVSTLTWWLAARRRKKWDAAFESAAQQAVAADGASPRR